MHDGAEGGRKARRRAVERNAGKSIVLGPWVGGVMGLGCGLLGLAFGLWGFLGGLLVGVPLGWVIGNVIHKWHLNQL